MKITLDPRELSDLYAMKTLYDYLIDVDAPYELEFRGYAANPHRNDILTGEPVNKDPFPNSDQIKMAQLHGTKSRYTSAVPQNTISVFSDIQSPSRGVENVQIDASLLKNCVKPLSPGEKMELRRKYGIPSGKPVLVLGFALGDTSEFSLLNEIHEHVTTVLVGDIDQSNFRMLGQWASASEEVLTSPNIHFVREYGVLKDYFALADLSINSRNLTHHPKVYLHNFVEASEGGPFFLVPPELTKQFGYCELQQAGAVRAFKNAKELSDGVLSYTSGFSGNHFNEERAAHLKKSRKNYLPQIADILAWKFLGKPFPNTDLIVSNYLGEFPSAVRIKHPDTNWEARKQ